MKSIRFLSATTLAVILAGCGGGSSSSTTDSAATNTVIQYPSRASKVGDQRVYQYTDTYNPDASNNVITNIYTQKSVVTAINPDGSSTRQLFDQNGLLISTNTSTIDSNHLLTSVTVSSTDTRTCTYAQPIPGLTSPFTIGEAYAGTFTYSCLPDALSATVSQSGNITALENVTVNGTIYSALKSEGTMSETYIYPLHPALPGPTVSRSFTATHTQWTEPNIGAVVQLNSNFSYTTNAPSSYVVKSSRILISYVNM